jgi:hypothetical protein
MLWVEAKRKDGRQRLIWGRSRNGWLRNARQRKGERYERRSPLK